MIYRAIGLMSGSSLDGLDIAFVEFLENGGKWSFEILEADCYSYSDEWIDRLKAATMLSALDYQILHCDYGHYLGQQVNKFIAANSLQYRVGMIASHGHTTFHLPAKRMTGQIGDGAAIAAETGLPVVSDLRAMDIALNGQGAPIVPIGEKLLLGEYNCFLNIGGIANISFNNDDTYTAYDICAANRVLNMLAQETGADFDTGGAIAAGGELILPLLEELNQLAYYRLDPPKSLANSFGIETVYPIIKKYNASVADSLRTYTEHVVVQIKAAIKNYIKNDGEKKLLVTGGGAFNTFLIEKLQAELHNSRITVVVPDDNLVQYKEALIMALIGVLRWREEYTVLQTVTGAARASIGGALWLGGEE
ncbi:MAG: anhydro-N-acetylmuramic acid kinase [Niabella sp.]